MNDALPQLDYAPAPFLAQKRRWLRRGLYVVAGVLLCIAVLQYGPSAWRQAWYLAGQRHCMGYSLSVSQVAYTNDPSEATNLLPKGYAPVARVLGPSITSGSPKTVSAGLLLNPLVEVGEDHIGSYARMGVGYLRQGVANAPLRTGCFLHAMQHLGSETRLVSVLFLEKQAVNGGDRLLEINALVWRPATWSLESRLELAGLTTLALVDLDHRQVRIYSAQLDPTDASHFTIPYEVDHHKGVIDGWIDATDHVRLASRDGSLADETAAPLLIPAPIDHAATRPAP
jgi:hypothetical protein